MCAHGVCMCACVCMSVYVHMCVQVCAVCVHVYVCMCVYVHMCVQVCAVCVHVYVCMGVHVCVLTLQLCLRCTSVSPCSSHSIPRCYKDMLISMLCMCEV